jgi:alanyl-tRNA synthetase
VAAAFGVHAALDFAGEPSMTKRIYYTDSYTREFSAEVIDRRQVDTCPVVILDQSAFYPESGGQPFDIGFLGETRVLKVVEEESGEVLHFLEREIPETHVLGRIDWERRFDHMQQHTGQHILSQAFLEVAQAQTLSFHMGQGSSTIDIEMAQPSASQMDLAQAMATDVVFQNRAVNILMADKQTLGSLGLRKESEREGVIRVIDIEGFDRSACGGTHVRNAGEIGLICILGYERYKGGTRVEFVAGGRALRAFQNDHELLRKLSRLYSAPSDTIPELAEKILQERVALARENETLRDQLLEREARELLANPARTAYASTVRGIFTGRSLESVKALAQKVTAQPGTLAIFAIADATQVIVSRSKNLPGSCNDAVKSAIAKLGGKGGGRPELAQAGGFPADLLDSWLQTLESYFLSQQ